MRDRIPLPEDEPVAEDMLQLVGIFALVLGGLNHLLLQGPPLMTSVLVIGGIFWYLVGTYLKAVD